MIESIISQIWGIFKLEDNPLFERLRELILGYFWPLLCIVICILSFTLGLHSKISENRPETTFETLGEIERFKAQVQNLKTDQSLEKSLIVASKGGKKYYFAWCKGALNIKDANKRYFASTELAESAGYTRASSCR